MKKSSNYNFSRSNSHDCKSWSTLACRI